MFKRTLHIKNFLNIVIIMILIIWQIFSVSQYHWYGINDLNNKIRNDQTIKINNDVHSEALFTNKKIKEIQNLFPYAEKQKYKHDSKDNLHQAELLLLGCLIEKKEFHYQKVVKGILNPRSPPQYHI